MAARPSGLVSSGKALGGNGAGAGSCGGQTNSSPLPALATMGLRLLLPLLLRWIQETQGSELDPNGRHVCMANRWILSESGGGGGGGGLNRCGGMGEGECEGAGRGAEGGRA